MKFDELLNSLINYPEREWKADAREFFSLLEADDDELVENPSVIGVAKLRSSTGRRHIYQFDDLDIKIQIEDEVTLFDRSSRERKGRASVLELDLSKSTITLTGSGSAPREALIIPSGYMTNEYLVQSLNSVRADLSKLPAIKKMLSRELEISPPRASSKKATQKNFSSLDSKLIETLSVAAELDEGGLIVQGPPGTGKTFTGAHIAAHLIAQGKKVGVMALSHKAINNLCIEIDKVCRKSGIKLRGYKSFSKDRDQIKSPSFRNVKGPQLVKLSTRDFDVIAGTVFQFPRLSSKFLDYIIFDEAGQLSLAAVVGCARSAKNFILLGDHKQLPQVNRAFHPSPADHSILEYLLDGKDTVPDGMGVFLNETRRMNLEITKFIGSLCYEDRLISHPKVANGKIELSADPSDPLGPRSVIFSPVKHFGNSQSSDEEGDLIKGLVSRLVKAKVPKSEIMILSPYRAHENLLRDKLGDEVRVGTVDRFQGQEADVAIYSMATSASDLMPRDFEFLYSINRLNVALSRARKKSILVCSPELLNARPRSVEAVRLVSALCKVKSFAS